MSAALLWIRGLPRWVHIAGAFAAACLAALLWLHIHDGRVIQKHDASVNLKVEQTARAADNAAADERTEDDRANARQQESFHEAIDAAPAGAPAPAAVALGCERLRRAGKVDADLPALCRH